MRIVALAWIVSITLARAAQAGVIRGTLAVPGGDERAVLDAVVYVDPLPPSLQSRWRPGKQTYTVIQRARQFAPRVTVVPVGSTVRFQNRDDVYHNVFSVSPAKRFDLGRYPPHAINQVTFSRAGIVNLFCEIHPGMAAWVVVLPHRLFTRPERDGSFALPKLPSGSYTVVAWHPSYGRMTREVEVPRHGDVQLDLRF